MKTTHEIEVVCLEGTIKVLSGRYEKVDGCPQSVRPFLHEMPCYEYRLTDAITGARIADGQTIKAVKEKAAEKFARNLGKNTVLGVSRKTARDRITRFAQETQTKINALQAKKQQYETIAARIQECIDKYDVEVKS